MKANPIVWWELASHDAEKTADFLKKLNNLLKFPVVHEFACLMSPQG
jgi:hypothetical protein